MSVFNIVFHSLSSISSLVILQKVFFSSHHGLTAYFFYLFCISCPYLQACNRTTSFPIDPFMDSINCEVTSFFSFWQADFFSAQNLFNQNNSIQRHLNDLFFVVFQKILQYNPIVFDWYSMKWKEKNHLIIIAFWNVFSC